MNNVTQAWRCYERGRAYNNALTPNQYSLVNTNIEFFTGNQWLNIPETPATARLPKPVFNIIKRVTSLFVASLTSSAVTLRFETLAQSTQAPPRTGGADAAECATEQVRNLFEKFKMDYRIREALYDGAQTGDYCAHFYFDPEAAPYGDADSGCRGEICMELVDGINVMFGNPNCRDVERQPYILIVGRDTVESLREEAQRRRGGAERDVTADSETAWQAGQGGRTELAADDDGAGKALYVYLYTKKQRSVKEKGPDGKERTRRVTSVHVTKATKSCVIYEDVDTGLSRYPIAWGNWERQKNQYHGRALVTGIIPNQIFINTMFAMIMRHLQLQSFPKTVYNADLIARWDNEIGKAIAVRNLLPGQPASSAVASIPPADMSAQILTCIDRAIACTKDCLGATDVQLGNVRPDNTSALMVLQSAAEVPLENIRAGLHEWIEDIGAILLDMMGTYYGVRPLVRRRACAVDDAVQEPLSQKETFDFTQFKKLWMNVRADVGATTYFSEIAMIQTLDNLRHDGVLDVMAYLERIPDKLIPRKRELMARLKESAALEQAQEQAQSGVAASALGGTLDSGQALGLMSGRVQQAFANAPRTAKKALVQRAQNMQKM